MQSNWVLVAESQLLREDLDSFSVCYSRHRGETYVFDAFTGEILRLLSGGSLSVDELAGQVADFLGEDPSEWITRVCDVLNDLKRIGLVSSS